MAVRVVVASLGEAVLVAHGEHGNALRQQHGRCEVAHLALAQPLCKERDGEGAADRKGEEKVWAEARLAFQ